MPGRDSLWLYQQVGTEWSTRQGRILQNTARFSTAESWVAAFPQKLALSFFPPRIQENGSLITILVIAAVFWIHRLIKFIYNICCYWEIHSFYLHALRIPMVRLGSWVASTTAQAVLGGMGGIPGYYVFLSVKGRSGSICLAEHVAPEPHTQGRDKG